MSVLRRSLRLKRKRELASDAGPLNILRPLTGNHTTLIPDTNDDELGLYWEQPPPLKKVRRIDDKEAWISATQTKNYLNGEPLLDYLKYYSSNIKAKNPHFSKEIARTEKRDKTFTSFLMDQGNKFEKVVVDLLYQRFQLDDIIDIGGGHSSVYSTDKYIKTMEAMNKGVPIILSPCVRNEKQKLFGVPDLIVRSDYINRLCKDEIMGYNLEVGSKFQEYYPKNKETVSAPKLRDQNGSKVDYHYLVIDIKFMTLMLRADGMHLLNSGFNKAYKSQVWIYSLCLEEMQGYNPYVAYILGRRWKFTSRGDEFKGESCFEKLAIIDYKTLDKPWISETTNAINWIRKLRSEGHKWDPFLNPNPVKELYPNMSNSRDYPYRWLKNKIVEKTDDITLLWRCGNRQRNLAHSNKVFKWTEPECTPQALGFFPEHKTFEPLKRMLDVNQNSNVLFYPEKMSFQKDRWGTNPGIEFYVDFETINDVVTDFSMMPYIEVESIIFMIGVGYTDPETSTWKYTNFTVNSINVEEELRICNEFVNFIDTKQREHNVGNSNCYHWAHAERSLWNKTFERHCGQVVGDWAGIEWYDLCEVFKKEPVAIKGCFGYGLKSIVKALQNHKFIETGWDSENQCTDGMTAMVDAYTASKVCRSRGIPLSESPVVQDIVKYNEIDCKVLSEILTFLRTKLE